MIYFLFGGEARYVYVILNFCDPFDWSEVLDAARYVSKSDVDCVGLVKKKLCSIADFTGFLC
jgi:hypothetical protein